MDNAKQWKPAPRPVDEAERLAALRGLCLLDTPPEPVFDDMVLLARDHFKTPMVAISLIDENRQYFKARIGIDQIESSRDDSFCAYTILRGEPTVVRNTLDDERFCSNAYVVGQPMIRFYAGVPLVSSNGLRLGTFCILDQSPRPDFNTADLSALRRFAAQTSRIIETRLLPRVVAHVAQDYVKLESRLHAVLESTANPVVLLSPAWDLLYVNQCARETLLQEVRYSPAGAYDVLPATSVAGWQALQNALESKERRSIQDLRADGTLWQIDIHPAMEGLVLFFSNLTDRRMVESTRSSEERLRQLVRLGSAMVWSAGIDGASKEGSQEWRDFTGQSMAELEGEGWLEALHPDDRRHTVVALRRATRTKQSCSVQHRVRRHDGFYRTMRARALPILNHEGEITEWFGTHEDCTDRDELEAQLKQAHERFVLATQAITVGIWDYDAVTGSAYYSARWAEIVGLPAVDTYGPIERWFNNVHPEDILRCRDVWNSAQFAPDHRVEWEFRCLHPDGSWQWILAHSVCQMAPDGSLLRATGSISNITEQKMMDPLTGIHNRAALIEQLQWRMNWQPIDDHQCGLFLIGIDHFTRINNSLGLEIGDQLLQQVGRRLSKTIASLSEGMVSRLVGDEFCILVSSLADVEDAETFAALLDYLLQKPFECSGQQLYISASVGVALSGFATSGTAVEMLEHADIALQHAKQKNPGRHRVFSQEMRNEIVQRMTLEKDLREGLNKHQFELHYQPKVDMCTRELVGFEALVRWRHPEQGLIPPNSFIPLMEECGLIGKLGRWCATEAIEQLAQWRTLGLVEPHVTMAINVAPQQLGEPDLLAFLMETLRTFDVPQGCLIVEITEGHLVDESPSSVSFLRGVVDAGMGLDLDDFGTGYSSLSYLHRLPFTCVKIDRSFVNRLESDPASAKLVALIVGLANTLKMKVVAEGVETQEQVKCLLHMGCSLAQGYFYAKPQSASGLAEYLRAARDLVHQQQFFSPQDSGKIFRHPDACGLTM